MRYYVISFFGKGESAECFGGVWAKNIVIYLKLQRLGPPQKKFCLLWISKEIPLKVLVLPNFLKSVGKVRGWRYPKHRRATFRKRTRRPGGEPKDFQDILWSEPSVIPMRGDLLGRFKLFQRKAGSESQSLTLGPFVACKATTVGGGLKFPEISVEYLLETNLTARTLS